MTINESNSTVKKFLFVILALFLLQAACKKEDDEKHYNLITITSGNFNGHTYEFDPNRGYYAVVDQNTNSYRLVFGSLDKIPSLAPGIMDIFFYHSGASSIIFPSADGQVMQCRLLIDDQECTFYASDVELEIYDITDNHMKGFLHREFTNSCENNVPASIEMHFSIDIVPF